MSTADDRSRKEARNVLTMAALGLWLVSGGVLDGWAHRRNAVESFYTPWHAMLYSGFIVTAYWVVREFMRERRGLTRSRYRVGIVGLAVFAVGGVGDLIWHSVFGIERGLRATTSPTHLILVIGAGLVLAMPARQVWMVARLTRSQSVALLMSMTSIAVTLSLTFNFASPFVHDYLSVHPLAKASSLGFDLASPLQRSSLDQRLGVTSILLTTLILFVPVLLLARRWRLPFGSFAVYFFVITGVSTLVAEGSRPSLILVGLLTGFVVDVLVRTLRAHESRMHLILLGALGPTACWGAFMTWVVMAHPIGWESEVWSGSIVMSAMLGAGVALLITGQTQPERSS